MAERTGFTYRAFLDPQRMGLDDGGPQCLTLDAEIDERGWLDMHKLFSATPYRSGGLFQPCKLPLRRFRGLAVFLMEANLYFVDPSSERTTRWAPWLERISDEAMGDGGRPMGDFGSVTRYCLDADGVLSQEGAFGHLGSYARQITIFHVVRRWPVPEVPMPPFDPDNPREIFWTIEMIAACLEG